MKIVTNFGKLMQLAHALGQAKKSGDPQRIAQAQAEHDAYHAICLRADTMLLGDTVRTHGDLCAVMLG